MTNWAAVRRDFPITKRFTYLDHASAGPMPKPVFEASLRYLKELGAYCDFSWNRWLDRCEEVRRKVAGFIGAEPDEIAFTRGTSDGMNLIAELIVREGPILTNALEFPSTTIPWIHRGAKVKFLDAEHGVISLERIQKNLNAGIKTILTSFVQYQNGFRQDLEALGRIKGNRYAVVNATQGFGYLALDVRKAKIDFLATNAYKWLMAGYGGGILFVRKPLLKRFKPASAGWRSVIQPEAFQNRSAKLKPSAARYEYGCPAFPNIFAIGAAIDYISGIGLNHVERRIMELTGYLASELIRRKFKILSPLDSKHRSGIIVFAVKNAAKLTNYLLAKRFYVSARGGGIRVAPHMYNTEAELSRFVKTAADLRDR